MSNKSQETSNISNKDIEVENISDIDSNPEESDNDTESIISSNESSVISDENNDTDIEEQEKKESELEEETEEEGGIFKNIIDGINKVASAILPNTPVNESTKTKFVKTNKPEISGISNLINEEIDDAENIESEYDDEYSDNENYLKKFDKEVRENYILDFHPDSITHNYDEIYNLARVVRNGNNIICDELHKTLPILTKYEKTRVLGQRAKQLNEGANPFIKISDNMIDGYLIALKELEEKKIPFIIKRPLPNGGSEYWHLEDLEIII